MLLISCDRIRNKLRNGEIVVSGDQWPIFLYHGFNYNPDDPWNGLFRSSLIVSVRPAELFVGILMNSNTRPTNTSLHPPALLRKSQRLRVRVMLVSTE